MLEQLFGSKTRVNLLGLFLNNPAQPYYLRQLARKFKIQLNSIRREVENLEKFGVIKSVSQPQAEPGKRSVKAKKPGSKKYFLANTSFILYPELKALLIKAQLLLEKSFVREVEKMARLKLLILTGIFVGREGFATDILLVGGVNHRRLSFLIKRFEKELNREINYTVMTYQEYKYRHDITDRFLYEILGGKKIVIVNKLD
ncbi:MAG: hypothetical protein A2744_04305 [Candidatus Buchananbacteria bacterium RIFCSPHIGHO2_01_FULL_44_11]|uniref:HTH arsR-type domain-containing protein n=1 Tax=Candidatus Buchananbacteria bacterium RIFCSPHIGHO2_01_FULL_44_11 TaxID=1797535 RepID=A0A1G1XZD9_9BACT|nr:MAG: hypothetical protein A2744_04305 [Candidatus Buchananbacteria bacterium RIFCSPHIGHO2_01_FULL_44_11]